MTKLLFKDLTLAAHPTMYVFVLLGCLVIVPSYPLTVIFMFGCLAQYITLTYSRETNDNWFTAVLPVTKREVVRARFFLAALAQTVQLFVSVPFAALRCMLNIPNNAVGIDANVAWYGIGFIIFAVFDLVFFPVYYRTGYKSGKAFILAMIPVVIMMAASEAASHFPALGFLDSTAPCDLVRQIPLLITGIVIYAAAMFTACRISENRFEKVDL